ncbi:MAG: DNA-binding NarL/FixJ family response regulator [Colwellia sp.]|jgi:DNA-binding NarL/FixJ family response regulator|uniref:response regulator transcription factor n=1 Tax=unclassified Colwellia TaxID=196834 RepID=UPI0015F59D39|nr:MULTISPECIES: response regulator transcription factor [unclassified Colwellia]MBA6252013.1 hypothetical protein [Colwellia sp. MB3u-55]MBA6398572.1 hypothetical protein [Colwellia sp. BRX10-4]
MMKNSDNIILKNINKSYQKGKNTVVVHRDFNLTIPVVMKQLNQGLNDAPMIDNLTEKEQQILKLVAWGFSNKEIARSIFLAEGTVKNHVSTILSKLNTRDRTRSVLIALNQGLI